MDMVRLLYLAALALLAACFLDAPLRAWRLSASARRLNWRPYGLANGLAILVGLAWLALAVWPAWETALLQQLGLPIGVRVLGGLLALLGASWAAWARVTLAREFLPTAAIRPEGHLVTSGPFRFMRHPFYSGAWLTLASGTLALASWITLGAALAMVPLLNVLARGEDRLLFEAYGTAFSDYARRVGRFFPRL